MSWQASLEHATVRPMTDYRDPTVPVESDSGANAIRIVGVCVLLVGLAMAVQVARTAWGLLDDHALIIQFADRIEAAAHVNANVAPMMQMTKNLNDRLVQTPGGPVIAPQGAAPSPGVPFVPGTMNAAYFAAWVVVLMLLALLARISLWTMAEGGKLALYSSTEERALRLAARQKA